MREPLFPSNDIVRTGSDFGASRVKFAVAQVGVFKLDYTSSSLSQRTKRGRADFYYLATIISLRKKGG
jgi:hypothetical protein